MTSIDTDTANGRMMFNMLDTIAEDFLDLNRERTMADLKSALGRGRKGGWRRKLCNEDMAVGRAMLADPTIPVSKVAERLRVSRPTLYRYFPSARANGKTPS